MADSEANWEETDSAYFIQFGEVFTPAREAQIATLLSLVPAEADEEFNVVDLASGAGVVTRGLLHQYSRCRVLALDGSRTMQEETRRNAGPFLDRLQIGDLELRRLDWLDHIPDTVRAVVSSLAIHHLDGFQKRQLFQALQERIEPGGALIIADLVEAPNEWARRTYAESWDSTVKEQSLKILGSVEAHEQFRDGWNHFVTPDLEFDKPSRLFDQLRWMQEAGFREVDCFWMMAGHSIYGGYV